MSAANGSAVKFFYAVEVAGAIPATAPNFIPIRFNTTTLARNTAQVDSAEINPLRQRPVSKQGTYSTQGEIAAELSDDSFDGLIEMVMQSAFAANSLKVGSTVQTIAILKRHTDIKAVAKTAITLSANGTDKSFNDSAAGLGAFAVGDRVTTSGFTTGANNGTFTVTVATASKLTIGGSDGTGIVTETAGASVTVSRAADYIFRGCRVNSLALSAQIDARVALTFSVIGTEAKEYAVPADAVFAAASASAPMVTSIGSITEGGVALAYATSYDFTIANGMTPLFSLHQRAAYDVSNGILTATGTLSAYKPDGTLYAKFLNETSSVLVMQFSDGVNTRTFTFPQVVYSQAADPVSGPDAIVQQLTWSAGYDATALTTVTVARSA